MVVAVLGASCLAYPGKPFDLRQLVTEADVIVVATIEKIDDVGSTNVLVGDQSVSARAHRARVLAERRIKGSCPEEFSIEFVTPSQFVGYPGVTMGRQIVFLKKQDNGYRFASRQYPSLPAAPGSSAIESGSDPLEAVVMQLGSVVSSPAASQSEKWIVLARAYGIPRSESFERSLRAGMDNTASLDLKYRIQTELVARDDDAELARAIDLLLASTLTDEQQQLFLLAIGNNVKNPTALPALARLLRSGNAPSRRAAAEALWHSAISDSVPDLVRILQDSDAQVRFYAVRALSDIANEPGWGGPSEAQFQEHEEEYLQHWKSWARSMHGNQ
jgi:hypothetical protein